MLTDRLANVTIIILAFGSTHVLPIEPSVVVGVTTSILQVVLNLALSRTIHPLRRGGLTASSPLFVFKLSYNTC